MHALNRGTTRTLLLCAAVLSSAMILMLPGHAIAQVDAVVSCDVAPPVLPVYAQPPMPEEGYVWTPGYWQWLAAPGYLWVPGTWGISPPVVNVLRRRLYVGMGRRTSTFSIMVSLGPRVGFYDGVNYGYGYSGSGYQGGRWDGGHFIYNSGVNNFGSVHASNTYRQNVPVNNASRVSYIGGAGAIIAEPNAEERTFQSEAHRPVSEEKNRHITAAVAHPGLIAKTNHGRPQIAATARSAQFEAPGVVAPRQSSAGGHPAQATTACALQWTTGATARRRPSGRAAATTSGHCQAATTCLLTSRRGPSGSSALTAMQPACRNEDGTKRIPIMHKNISIGVTLLLLIGAAPLLGACHTTAGVGQDISATGHVLTHTADKATP